jgi:NAD/NADP transhydrogenase alpha subunit
VVGTAAAEDISEARVGLTCETVGETGFLGFEVDLEGGLEEEALESGSGLGVDIWEKIGGKLR